MKNKFLFVSFFFLLFIKQHPTFANGFDSLAYKPATDSYSYFGTWSPQTLHHFDWEAGTSLQFMYHSLQVVSGGSARVNGVLDESLVQHFTGSVGIINKWLQVGIDLPVAWIFSFRDPAAAAPDRTWHTKLGDLQVHVKSFLYQSPSQHFGIGLLSTLALPTGSESYFLEMTMWRLAKNCFWK